MHSGTGKTCKYIGYTPTLGGKVERNAQSNSLDLLLFQVNLGTLDLASNQITRLENVAHLEKLEEFWVRNLEIM